MELAEARAEQAAMRARDASRNAEDGAKLVSPGVTPDGPGTPSRPSTASRPDGGYEGAAIDEEIMNAELARRDKRMIKELRLKYRRYPWALWSVGIFVMWFGLYLFYHLMAGTHWGGTFIKSFTKR